MEMTGIAPILENISKDLNVPLGAAANLMMAYVLAIAVFFTAGGMVCDRYGLTVSLVVGLLCCCVPAITMPLIAVKQLNTVFCLRFVQGISVAFVFATVAHVLAHWFPVKERGIASALMASSMPIGSSIGVLTAPYLLEMTGNWQQSIALLSLPGWVGIVCALTLTKRPMASTSLNSQHISQTTHKEMSFVKAMALPQTWIGVCIMFCNAWCHFCLYNIIPSFLSTKMPMGAGLAPTLAGKLSMFLTLSGFFAMITGGVLIDRVAKGKYQIAMRIGFFLTGIANFSILIPGIQTNTFSLSLCLFFAGCGMPFMSASISYYLVSHYPIPIVGRMMGVWYGLGTFGGALGIYTSGVSISNTGNFQWAIFQISIAATIGFIFSWLLPFIKTETEKFDYATFV